MMSADRLHRVISRFVDVRPDESLFTFLLFIYFFLLTSTAYILKPIKISYFLRDKSPEDVVIPYLITALIMGFVVSLNTKLLNRYRKARVIAWSLIFFSISLGVFAAFFDQKSTWLPIAYWFWVEIFTVTSITQFWMMVNDYFNPRQARRIIGFLVRGGLIGGMAGSLIAGFLAKIIGTGHLLFLSPLLLLICAFIVSFMGKGSEQKRKDKRLVNSQRIREKGGLKDSYLAIIHNKYLFLLSGIMFFGIVATTLIDYQYISVIDSVTKFQNQTNALTQFIGQFMLILLVVSFMLQTFLTNHVLRKFGIRFALLVTPAAILLLSLGVLLPAVFLLYWALVIKGADKGLSHSLNQSVRELLYIPVPPKIKYKAKLFIDMFVNKFAKGIAALMLVAIFYIFKGDFRHVSIVLAVCTGCWIGLVVSITREYVKVVKNNIKMRWQDADQLLSEKVDLDKAKLVFDTLESKRRSSVLYAMNLFNLVQSERISREAKKIISLKSDVIQASSMDSLLDVDGESLFPDSEEALYLKEMESEVDKIFSLDVYQQLMMERIQEIVLNTEEGKKSETSRMEAAKLLGMINPSPQVFDYLKKMLADESPEVNIYAIESAVKHKSRELIPHIIQLLEKTAVRRAAAHALVQYGEKVIDTLRDYLADSAVPVSVRKTIPEIMAGIESQKSADFLVLELRKRDENIYDEIIGGLFKLRTNNQKVRFEERKIAPEIFHVIEMGYLDVIDMQTSHSQKSDPGRSRRKRYNLESRLKSVFELLSLIYSYSDIRKAYQNICKGEDKAVDYSVELLDNLLKKDMKEFLLPLIENIPLEEKARQCRGKLNRLKRP